MKAPGRFTSTPMSVSIAVHASRSARRGHLLRDDVPTQFAPFTDDNARFFTEPLPGQPAPLNSPGGVAKLGRIGADTPLVADYPSSD
jgi:hypothetical protein